MVMELVDIDSQTQHRVFTLMW